MPKQLEFLRLQDLADLFGVSKVTIWRMRKRGEIPPPIRISRYVVGWPRPTIERIIYRTEGVEHFHDDSCIEEIK